jgi:carboxypeptidase C (cathepsin A)
MPRFISFACALAVATGALAFPFHGCLAQAAHEAEIKPTESKPAEARPAGGRGGEGRRDSGAETGRRREAGAARDAQSEDASERGGEGGGETPARAERRLPRDAVTRHGLNLGDRTLALIATAGSVRLTDDRGDPEADIAYTYYRLADGEAKTRPIAFFFNGGPGSASAWLQLGLAGPWRLPMGGAALSPSAPPELSPNAETWLDFADLVFIDPVATGFSRFATREESARKRLLSVDGDARAAAQAVRRITLKHERLLSPKFIVGESYSGIRAPKVAYDLVARQGVGVRGLILVSPVLDFAASSNASLLRTTWWLPSMAATARELKGPVTRADLADVEAYARGELLVDLARGQADKVATARVVEKVAGFTGLDPALVRRVAGRLSPNEFRRELERAAGLLAGRYDASVLGRDPFPEAATGADVDPSLDPLIAPMTSAVVDLTTRRLNWRPDGAYSLLNMTANHRWDWGAGLASVESVTQLRQLLALDPQFKLLVAHGLFDLATPYFGSQITLDQLPDLGRERIRLTVLPGGHMFYSRDGARTELRKEAEAMMK